MSIFPNANQLRRFGARNVRAVLEEVRTLEDRILEAQIDGIVLSVTVNDSPFGVGSQICSGISPVTYFRVWKGVEENDVAEYQMNTVIEYFQNLGYSIVRQTNPDTQQTLMWYIRW